MKRFLPALGFALLGLLPLSCSAAEAPSSFQEGTHYKRVLNPQQPADPKKIEVTEIFWYGCPHCYSFDPTLDAWRAKAPGDVTFNRLPATLGRAEGEMHARAYYVAEALGVIEKIHQPLFKAIHDEHKRMNTLDQLRELFAASAGVKPADFDQASSGFMVDSRLRRADSLIRAYGITSVPALVIDGKWHSNGGMAGSYDKLMQLTDELIAKRRKERGL